MSKKSIIPWMQRSRAWRKRHKAAWRRRENWMPSFAAATRRAGSSRLFKRMF